MQAVAFEALNQIWVMESAGSAGDHRGQLLQVRPGLVSGRRKIAYSSDKNGIMKVYVYDTATRGGDELP